MGSNASCWPLLSTSTSISASRVPAFADSTSSSGSYNVTPDSPDRSSVRSDWLGRPSVRFEPRPTTSSVLPSASAQRTASSTSLASRAFSASVMLGSTMQRTDERSLVAAEKPGLILLDTPELNAETPAHLLDDDITPVARLFARNTGAMPAIGAAEIAAWRLTVDGAVRTPRTWTIAELQQE